VDFTPQEYRRLYDIYPGKGTVEGDAVDGLERMKKTLESLGRKAV